MAEHARWCARCWEDDARSGSPRYVRKLWILSVVDACPEHRVLLFDRCACCGSRQPPIGPDVPVGFCALCGEDLVAGQVVLDSLDVDDALRRLWYARQASVFVYGADVAAVLGLTEEYLHGARDAGFVALFAFLRAQGSAALLARIASWEAKRRPVPAEQFFSVLWSARFSVAHFFPPEVRPLLNCP